MFASRGIEPEERVEHHKEDAYTMNSLMRSKGQVFKALKGMPAHMEKAENIAFGKTPIDYLLLNVPSKQYPKNCYPLSPAINLTIPLIAVSASTY